MKSIKENELGKHEGQNPSIPKSDMVNGDTNLSTQTLATGNVTLSAVPASAEDFMAEHNIEDEEFDRFYSQMLDHIREYGTHGTEAMLKFVAAQLDSGDEVL